MTEYVKAGMPCTRCKYGQAFWVWEPISRVYTQPPFKTIKVLKCVQCGHVLEYDKSTF